MKPGYRQILQLVGLFLLMGLPIARAESAASTASKAAPLPPLPEQRERLVMDGYFRTRGHSFYNLDLNRGPTPTTEETLFPLSPDGSERLSTADMRLRVDVTVIIASEVRVHARVDGLDNVLLGSTPNGYPMNRWVPSIYASQGQEPPSSGVNASSDSLQLRRAWGEARMPFGTLVIGRMGMPLWGAGIVADPGDSLDADFHQDVDRLGFATTLFDHIVGVSWDWNAIGPTTGTGSLWGSELDLYGGDDVHTFSATVMRHLDPYAVERRNKAGTPAFTYGTWLSWRSQEQDASSWYRDGLEAADGKIQEGELITRDFRLFGADLFLRVDAPRFRLLGEIAYFQGSIGNLTLLEGISVDKVTLHQVGGSLQALWFLLPQERLSLGIEIDYASGDSAPGMGIASNLDQVSTHAGDLDGPQFSLPSDGTLDNFRFSPNHRVDLILWRRLMGTITDAVVLRPAIAFKPHERLSTELALVWSQAVEATSTPGGTRSLGKEIDLSARWELWRGLEARAAYGIFLPGSALDNTELGLQASSAQAGEATLAFTF